MDDAWLRAHHPSLQATLPRALALVELAITAAVAGVLTPLTPLVLLEDLFEVSTVAVCEEAFELVESHRDVWITVCIFWMTRE